MKTMSAHRILLTLNFGPVAQHLFTAKTVKGGSWGQIIGVMSPWSAPHIYKNAQEHNTQTQFI